jgi:hypothetical protein
MKRFYCEKCKKIKRARKYPRKLTTPNNLPVKEVPAEQRIGLCYRHSNDRMVA